MTDIPSLIVNMRSIITKLKRVEESGQLIRQYEIGPKSFVQLVEFVPMTLNPKGPGTWSYHQFWMDKAPAYSELLLGAYLNEKIATVKVIGIYEQGVTAE